MAISFEITNREGNKSFSISLDMNKILIGRGSPCDIILPCPSVSYLHGKVQLVGSNYEFVDNGSKNGTFINGKRLIPQKPYRLNNEDCICICGYKIKVKLSVGMDEPFNAEKTNLLAKQLFISETKELEAMPACQIEIVSGDDRGKVFTISANTTKFSVGKGPDCHFKINIKQKFNFELTPGGWKVFLEDSSPPVNMVALPSGNKLKDGSRIEAGKTVMVFYDFVERAINDLKTDRNLEKKVPPFQNLSSTPLDNIDEGKISPISNNNILEEQKIEPQYNPSSLLQEKTSNEHISNYKIAALAVGIVIFLISLLLLILII